MSVSGAVSMAGSVTGAMSRPAASASFFTRAVLGALVRFGRVTFDVLAGPCFLVAMIASTPRPEISGNFSGNRRPASEAIAMRFLGLPFLTALAACGGGSAAADAGSQPLVCSATVDGYCAQNPCVRHTTDRPCDAFFLCVEFEVYPGEQASELDYYDHVGQLFAVVTNGVCLAGPTSFTPPILKTCAQPGPGPCDAGT